MKFKEKMVVVTGGVSGIGRDTVLRFAAEGATVLAADINDEAGEQLVADGKGLVHYQRCDITKVAEIEALMQAASTLGGGIDVLFNNAGTPGSFATIDEITPDQWDGTINLLLRSTAMGIRYAVPFMKGRRNASIINTTSVAGHRIGLGSIAYSTSKAGVLHLTRLAAAQLSRYGIRVNSVSPGLINTNIFAHVLDVAPEKIAEMKVKLAERSARAQPIGRPGMPDDIAGGVLFLASEDASFVTGTDLLIDGGMILGERSGWDPNSVAPWDISDLLMA